MSLRRRIEDAFLARWADNERILSAAREGETDLRLVERYEAYQSVLEPIVADIVFERNFEASPGYSPGCSNVGLADEKKAASSGRSRQRGITETHRLYRQGDPRNAW